MPIKIDFRIVGLTMLMMLMEPCAMLVVVVHLGKFAMLASTRSFWLLLSMRD